MATSLADIHTDIIQTHILPFLDGQSLSTVATVSSSLKALSSDHHLWAHISNSNWPSITHPRLRDVISTFPQRHRSFFQDSFPSLTADVNHRSRRRSWSKSQQTVCSSCQLDFSSSHSYTWPSELISAVDIRYQNDIVYSKVEFTETTTDFKSSALRVELNDNTAGILCGSKPVSGISRSIDLEVDELAGADEATLSHLKESLTLNWILIDPSRKRAGNLSSIKPVSVRPDWMTNETIVQYVTVLPGCDLNEMVQCRIQVVLGGSVGLQVKKVVLQLKDLDCNSLNGREFLVITQGAIMEENNVRRKVVVDDEERLRIYKVFKELKREKKEWVKNEDEKREFAIKMNYIGILVSFFFCVYFLILLLK